MLDHEALPESSGTMTCPYCHDPIDYRYWYAGDPKRCELIVDVEHDHLCHDMGGRQIEPRVSQALHAHVHQHLAEQATQDDRWFGPGYEP